MVRMARMDRNFRLTDKSGGNIKTEHVQNSHVGEGEISHKVLNFLGSFKQYANFSAPYTLFITVHCHTHL